MAKRFDRNSPLIGTPTPSNDAPDPVGASGAAIRLAREAFGVLENAFASKPAPTVDVRRASILCSLKVKCGSGLAREDGLKNAAILKA
ncbi:hypothetical protein [Pseudomonas sp. QTF5]|uniref:hypothetical protein n=1 Tax=Pseudomonas sp. QTF5 TaxID=1435425 RepID=UPI0004BE4591|nr:hypothetical protein [Pseudomonas sp. QTF5]